MHGENGAMQATGRTLRELIEELKQGTDASEALIQELEETCERDEKAMSAAKLQGGHGACHFLKGKRCQIYEIRPRFCRQFPVHVHVMRRVQLDANLSCRGITEGGSSLRKFGEEVLSHMPRNVVSEELAISTKHARDFDEECREAGVYQSPKRIAAIAAKILPIVAGEEGVGKLLGFADEEPEISEMPEDKILHIIDNSEVPEDLEDVAQEGNYEQFDLDDLAWLPVYMDEAFSWNVFQSKKNKINWMALEEDGSLQLKAEFDTREIKLLPRDEMALAVFADYAKLLTMRDHFLGYASHVCAEQEYENDMLTVYIGVLGTTLLDLWWRASLIGKMFGKTAIDKWLATEGIRAYDMDCLDAPTIGAFI